MVVRLLSDGTAKIKFAMFTATLPAAQVDEARFELHKAYTGETIGKRERSAEKRARELGYSVSVHK